MSGEILGAIITGLLSFAGVVVTVACGNKLTLYRIAQLEKKVDKHNNAVERLYIAEGKIRGLEHDIQQIQNKELAS